MEDFTPKKVILFGPTGAGKSTIANLLCQHEVYYNEKDQSFTRDTRSWFGRIFYSVPNRTNLFPIGDNDDKATTDVFEAKSGNEWKVYDTPGVLNGSNSKLNDEDVLKLLRKKINGLKMDGNFHYVFIVLKFNIDDINAVKKGTDRDKEEQKKSERFHSVINLSKDILYGPVLINRVLIVTQLNDRDMSQSEKDFYINKYTFIWGATKLVPRLIQFKFDKHNSSECYLNLQDDIGKLGNYKMKMTSAAKDISDKLRK